MQNKKTIIILGILTVVVGAAAFIGGRMLNGNFGVPGLGMPMGSGEMISVSIQVTPAPELPTTEPVARGLFIERKDNSIMIGELSMQTGGKGVVIQKAEGGSQNGEPSVSGPEPDGPQREVVITSDTIIYLETTDFPEPSAGEEQVIQQTVAEASLDDLSSQSFVTVWGRQSGDRIIAEVLFISNPVVFKRP